jgi:cysteine synthase A
MNRDASDGKAGDTIADSVLDLIGHTPLVRLNRLPGPGSAEVLAKLESYSPGGSVKDRLALHVIVEAERQGLIEPDTAVIEPTSGNTGIGLAVVCAARGYRCILVMPDSMSLERTYLLQRLGAEVVLTPARDHMEGAMRRADQLARGLAKWFMPLQFSNLANPEAHRRTTALEILKATDKRLDAFVAGIGTGGTLTGVGSVLKQQVPAVRLIGIEPASSAVLSGQPARPHKIQGIGAGFVPKVLDRSLLDELRTVSDRDAFEGMKQLAASEGILAGMSSGAAVHIALAVARELGPDRRVVVMLPDTGERYLSVQSYFEL